MKQRKEHMTDILFVMALFCVFSASSLLVVIFGANVYRGVSRQMSLNYDLRTSLTYLAEKVRQGDTRGNVLLSQVGEEDALVLRQEMEQGVYHTWIYPSQGTLYEVTVREDTPVKPGDGQAIMALQGLELQAVGERLIELRVTGSDGSTYDTTMYLRSGPVGGQ